MMDQPCPLCGGSSAPLHEIDRGGGSIFTIAKCRSCTGEFLSPLPSQDQAIETQQNEFNSPAVALEESEYNRGVWNAERSLIERLGYSGGRVLDVGCNGGHFLDALGAEWEKHGIEIAKAPARIAREKGIRVESRPLDEVRYPDGYFDVVTMYALLEHVTDPVAVIGEAARILRKGGMLVVMTGARDTLKARMKGKSWHMYCPPIHTYFFTSRSLTRLLESHSFSTVYRKYTSGGMRWFRHRSGIGAAISHGEYYLSRLVDRDPLWRLPFYDHLYLYVVKTSPESGTSAQFAGGDVGGCESRGGVPRENARG